MHAVSLTALAALTVVGAVNVPRAVIPGTGNEPSNSGASSNVLTNAFSTATFNLSNALPTTSFDLSSDGSSPNLQDASPSSIAGPSISSLVMGPGPVVDVTPPAESEVTVTITTSSSCTGSKSTPSTVYVTTILCNCATSGVVPVTSSSSGADITVLSTSFYTVTDSSTGIPIPVLSTPVIPATTSEPANLKTEVSTATSTFVSVGPSDNSTIFTTATLTQTKTLTSVTHTSSPSSTEDSPVETSSSVTTYHHHSVPVPSGTGFPIIPGNGTVPHSTGTIGTAIPPRPTTTLMPLSSAGIAVSLSKAQIMCMAVAAILFMI